MTQKNKDPEDQLRPALYPHPPKERADFLELLLAKESGFTSYIFHGMANLVLAVTLLCLFKIVYDDVQKRGVIILNQGLLNCAGPDFATIMLIYFTEGIMSLSLYFSVKLHSKKKTPKVILVGAYILIQTAYFALPFTFPLKLPPALKLFRFMFQLVVQLKMHSFFMTYHHCSLLSQAKPTSRPNGTSSAKKESLAFLSIKTYLYFIICAPSIVFEPHFIKKRAPNKWLKIMKRSVVAALSALTFIFAFSQYQIPLIIQNPGLPWNGDLSTLITIVLATMVMFLSGFVAYFFCFLNLTAMLYDFGDYNFYDDWWNSLDVAEFWRKWNKPVHEWFTRHIYIESIHFLGVSKQTAMAFVFLASAILHQYFFVFTFNSRIPCFFLGMVAQAPIVIIGRLIPWKPLHSLRNLNVWASLSFSQNLLAFVYLREWVQREQPLNYGREFWCPAS